MSSWVPRAREGRLVTGSRTRTRGPLWCALAVASACAGRLPGNVPVLPEVPRPPVAQRVDGAAPLPASRLLLPLETDLAQYEPLLGQVLREQLVLTQLDWTRVSAPGDKLEVETRIDARIGHPVLRVDGRAIRVEVPLSYWGQLRSRARTRFGSIWLSKGTSWGTAKNPARALLALSVRPDVDGQWRLRTRTKLVGLALTAPRFAKLCAGGVIRVCLGSSQAEKLVHALIEREVRSSAPRLLAAVDQQIQHKADLRSAAEMAFRALTRPAGPEQLWLDIDDMGLGPLHGHERRAQLDLEVVFRPSWHGGQPSRPQVLPARKPISGKPSSLVFDMQLPFGELSSALTQAFAGTTVEQWKVVRVQALGAGQSQAGLLLALTGVAHQAQHTVYLAARPEVHAGYLQLRDAKFSQPSAKLLRALEVDGDQLVQAIEARARVQLAAYARRHVGTLQNRLALLTLAFGAVSLELESESFREVRFLESALAVRVETGVLTRVLH